MSTFSPPIVLVCLLVVTSGCGSARYDPNAPSGAPSEHGYIKTSSMQEDTAGATTEDEATVSAPDDDDASQKDSIDDIDMVHAPAGGPGTGGGP